MNNYFPGVIGQQKVKDTLSFHIDSYNETGVIDPLLFVAAKGVGKTYFCTKVGAALKKDMMEIHGGTIKSKDQFISQILMDLPEGDEGKTIFIDEFHAIPVKVAELFLTLFNGLSKNKGVLNYDEIEIVIDFTKISFLFATTERDKIFSPLLDRLSMISFEEYTQNEIGRIVKLHSGTTSIEDLVLDELSQYCRGNARSAEHLGRYIIKYCGIHKKEEFLTSDVAAMTKALNFYPLGLNQQEISILKFILNSGIKGITLTSLSSKTGFDAKPQQALEKYLLKMGLMDIDGRRHITKAGIDYLNKIEENEL
jgi:Holliday junction resolvasome RuvABC ATP-dependent DNA helicase subunit